MEGQNNQFQFFNRKIIFGIGSAFAILIFLYVGLNILNHNQKVKSSLGIGPKIIEGKKQITALPETEDFDINVTQVGTFSISPDNKWIVYGGNLGLVFYRLTDNKKFVIRSKDIVDATKKIPTVDMEYLSNTVTPEGHFNFFGLTSNWTSDSKKFYAELDSGIYFKTGPYGISYQFPVIIVNNNSVPSITFEEIDSGTHEDWPNRVQEMKNLTCSDCNTRAAFISRYQKVQSRLPVDFQNMLQYDWRKQPIVSYRSNEKLVVSSEGKAYYVKSKDNGVDLVELNANTGLERVIAHFYLSDQLNRKTRLTDLTLSPDDKKIAVGLSNIDFGGFNEAYVVDVGQNKPTIYSLGKNIYYDKYWNSTSDKLYFGCPSDVAGVKDKSEKNHLCVLSFNQ